MIFTTQRGGSSVVATWDPRHGRFSMLVDGRLAARANRVGAMKSRQFAWSPRPTSALVTRLRALAEDLEAMLAVIADERVGDLPLKSMVLPELGGWRCRTCSAPMITARARAPVGPIECPFCAYRAAAEHRCATALAIALAETCITRAIEDDPTIRQSTRSEVAGATAELRRLSELLSAGAAPPEDRSGGETSSS
jgi:hypothetical protein